MTMPMQAGPTPLLSLRALSMRFAKRRSLSDTLARRPQQVVSAVNGVDLDVMPGETLGIVGESGCGKSTLARLIAGLHRPTAGDILFEGKSVVGLKGARRRAYNRRVQMMFQDPYTSLNPRMTVRDTLREAITVHRMRDGAAIDRRVDELLDLVRLPEGPPTSIRTNSRAGSASASALRVRSRWSRRVLSRMSWSRRSTSRSRRRSSIS